MSGETPPSQEPADDEQLQEAAEMLGTQVGPEAAQDRARVEEVADAAERLRQALEAKRQRDGR